MKKNTQSMRMYPAYKVFCTKHLTILYKIIDNLNKTC